MPTLTAEQIITLLAQYVTDTGESIDVLIVGALALQAYGVSHRTTRDLNAELQGPLIPLMDYTVDLFCKSLTSPTG